MERPCLALEFVPRELYGELDEQDFRVSVRGDSFCGELEIYDDYRKLAALCSAFGEIPVAGVAEFTLGYGFRCRTQAAPGTTS